MSYQESLEPTFFEGTITKTFSECQDLDFYDEQAFDNDASSIVNHIAKKLGFPVHKIEITLEQIYACIEEALIEYTQILNDYKVKEDYFNVLGTKKDNNISNKFIPPNINYAIEISKDYGLQAHVSNDFPIHTGSINAVAGQQTYNWKQEYFDNEHPDDTFVIKRVFHQEPPAGLISRQNNTFEEFTFGNFQKGTIHSGYTQGYTLLPSSYTISRIMDSKTKREIRSSSISFEVKGGKLKIFPVPEKDFKIFFEYILGSETKNRTSSQDDNLIKSPSDLMFDVIQWSSISKAGKIWIIKMALAHSQIQLGYNRRKYSSIPYSGGDITLDGDSLVNEGISEVERLRTSMKEKLNELSYERGMEIKRNISDSTEQILSKVPLPFVKG